MYSHTVMKQVIVSVGSIYYGHQEQFAGWSVVQELAEKWTEKSASENFRSCHYEHFW
jgi:hypothetical protein